MPNLSKIRNVISKRMRPKMFGGAWIRKRFRK